MPRKKKKRKRKKRRDVAPSPPELTGLARLLVESPEERLDLHGLNADQARTRVRFFFQRHVETSPGRVVHIITGKGIRSEGAPVLLELVREMLQEDRNPGVAEWAGLHGGGGFAVRIGPGHHSGREPAR